MCFFFFFFVVKLVCLAAVVRGEFQSVVVGLKGRDFVIVVADATFRRGIVAMDGAHDKVTLLDDGQLLGAIGDVGEAEDFGEIVKQSLALHRLRAGTPTTPAMVRHFIRRQLVSSRRENGFVPNVKLVFAALDDTEPTLAWLDETGADLDLDYAAHGLGAALVVGHLDRHYRDDLTQDQALDLLKDCLLQLHDRYAPSTSAGFLVKVIDQRHHCHVRRWRFVASTDNGAPTTTTTRVVEDPPTRAPPTSMRLTTYTSRRTRHHPPLGKSSSSS
mmetsp:Transcript_10799/g.35782  ORF Transcript_10799/g.35782 Transcript_10799/m.35782 type:complete len:273 (-) Transcript_10799:98-916(-)